MCVGKRLVPFLLLTLPGLLCGCGNKGKAELMLTIDGMIKHPELLQAMTRVDLAGTVAAMGLSPEQAAALGEWAADHGAAIRSALEAELTKAGELAPKIIEAADEMVRSQALSPAAQKAVAERVLGDHSGLVTDEEPPFSISDEVEQHVESIRPLTAGLSERQQLVALGQWKNVAEAVTKLLTVKDNEEAESQREALVSTLMQARGHGFFGDEAVTAKAKEAIDKIPTGQDAAEGVEQYVAALFEAVPAADADSQAEDVAATMATLLALEPAVELLALVR